MGSNNTKLFSGFSVDDVIRAIYLSHLRREPDNNGFQHFKNSLISGDITLEKMMWLISHSEERNDFQEAFSIGDPLKFWRGSQVVFLHIEKCAGSSVKSWLEPHFAPWQIYQFGLSHRISNSHKLHTGHFPLNEVLPFVDNPVKIVVLREPKQRIASLYRYMNVHKENKDEASVLAQTLDFSNWLTSNNPSVLSVISNIYVFRATGVFIPPVDVDKSTNEVKKILKKASAVYRNFDVVGDTRNMPDFFSKISSVLGIDMPSVIPEYNVSNDDSTNEELLRGMTKRAKQAIEIHTRYDYAIYNEFFG